MGGLQQIPHGISDPADTAVGCAREGYLSVAEVVAETQATTGTESNAALGLMCLRSDCLVGSGFHGLALPAYTAAFSALLGAAAE